MKSFFQLTTAMPLLFAVVLLAILVISFRSRAVVFCQYLQKMTGISLRPSDVSEAYRQRGEKGVRELFLDLIIREDLKHGPLEVPEATPTAAESDRPALDGADDDARGARVAIGDEPPAGVVDEPAERVIVEG